MARKVKKIEASAEAKLALEEAGYQAGKTHCYR
jgi:hypothetical protein